MMWALPPKSLIHSNVAMVWRSGRTEWRNNCHSRGVNQQGLGETGQGSCDRLHGHMTLGLKMTLVGYRGNGHEKRPGHDPGREDLKQTALRQIPANRDRPS